MKTNKQEVVQELLAEMSKQVYLKDGTRFIAEKQVIQALQTAYEAGRKEAIKECEGCVKEEREKILEWLGSHSVWDANYPYIRKALLIDAFKEEFLKPQSEDNK